MREPNNSELPPLLPPILKAVPAPTRGPWGFWATTGFGIALIGSIVTAQGLAAIVYLIVHAVLSGDRSFPSFEVLVSDGTVFCLATVLSTLVTISLCICFVWLRKGPKVADYLGLSWPGTRTMIIGILALFGLVVASDSLTVWLGRPVVPDVMVEIYRSTTFKPLIWVVIVAVGPMAEEFLFRGFLFRGWQDSPLSSWGTILLTAAAWAAIHLQYDLYGIITIFVSGIFLGLVRLRTGSVWFCVLLHGVMNLIATIEAEFFTVPV